MKTYSDQSSEEKETEWLNKQDILDFGKKLINKSLRNQAGIKEIPGDLLDIIQGGTKRGSIGILLENYYYNITPGNEARPDFKEVGVELKSTPIKKLANGDFSAKERLVLNAINFKTEKDITFKESSFYKKNSSIMLFSYLYEKNIPIGDLKIKIADLLEYENLPEKDRKIIKSDWDKINQKISLGHAHELSEGDTLYLGACTKSATSENRRLQWNDVPAKPRAYSFKAGYMTSLTRRFLGQSESDVESIIKSDEINKAEDFESYVINKFKPYIGKTVDELSRQFDVDTKSKAKLAMLARRIMGIKGSKIEEFDKADILMKTIQVQSTGKVKESMSFPTFKFKELVEENWDDENNTLRGQLEKRFFLVVFKCDGDCKGDDNKKLEKVMFWTMPVTEIEKDVKAMWLKTQDAINSSDLNKLPKASDNKIIHVRPHGKNAEDVDELPDGQKSPKKCFWINGDYIQMVIK